MVAQSVRQGAGEQAVVRADEGSPTGTQRQRRTRRADAGVYHRDVDRALRERTQRRLQQKGALLDPLRLHRMGEVDEHAAWAETSDHALHLPDVRVLDAEI